MSGTAKREIAIEILVRASGEPGTWEDLVKGLGPNAPDELGKLLTANYLIPIPSGVGFQTTADGYDRMDFLRAVQMEVKDDIPDMPRDLIDLTHHLGRLEEWAWEEFRRVPGEDADTARRVIRILMGVNDALAVSFDREVSND